MPSRRLTPGRRFWSALIVLMALAAVVETGAFQSALTTGWNSSWLGHVGWMLGLLVAVLALLASLMVGLRVSSRVSPHIDRVFSIMILSWVLRVFCHAWHYLVPEDPWGHWAMHASYQLTVTTAAFFMLACASLDAPRLRLLCWFHLVLGQVLAVGGLGSLDHHEASFQTCPILNVVFSTVLLLSMGRRLFATGGTHAWMVLGACLTGWGVALLETVPSTAREVSTAPAHYVLVAYLLMLWLLVTQRLGRVLPAEQPSRELSEHSLLGSAFANTHLRADGAEMTVQEEADRQVSQSRRRIAQDLHDGVGSQIVSMISSLDPSVPQQRDFASALEQCLLDVKILVDDIDATHEGVLEALGRLRYRVQHSLDRLGIEMSWEVEIGGALERMNDDRSRQVLRVAQEALANVMRYSRATHVSVRCAAERSDTVMVLEVQDNGSGFEVPEPGRCIGRGLAGMRRRAQAIHGELTLLSEPGCGTLVRLQVPL